MNPVTNLDAAPRRLTWLIGPLLTALGAAFLLAGPGRATVPTPAIPRPVPAALASPAPAAPAEGGSTTFRANLISTTPRVSVSSTRAIEDVRVGDRVVAGNPEGSANERAVDPASWVRVALTLRKPDDVVEVVLLRSRAWADTVGARPGQTVLLNLAELGASGPALVNEVGPCPPIRGSAGQVVTGTFRHRSARVLTLALEGQSEAIGVTASHPFWSEDRGQFVKSGQLVEGERLRTLEGQTRVASIRPREGRYPVYNIEVHSEHVYRVTTAGILVHNTGCEEVIVDSNVVYDSKAIQGLLAEGKVPVITETIQKEVIANSQKLSGAMQVPKYFSNLKVVSDSVNVNQAIQIRALIRGMTTKLNLRGLLGDGRIGSTALQTGRALMTKDKLLIKAMEILKGTVIKP